MMQNNNNRCQVEKAPAMITITISTIMLLCLNFNMTTAFQSSLSHNGLSNQRLLLQKTSFVSLNVATTIDNCDESSSSKTMKFVSKFGPSQSNPLPTSTSVSSEDVIAFFREPTNLSFGDSMPSEIVPATPLLVDEWFEAYNKLGFESDSQYPDPNRDHIVCVRTAGIKIPGLKVEWCGHIGTRLVLQDDSNKETTTSLPTLEFVLIKDELSAQGIKPLVWMFEKATKSKSVQNYSTATKQQQRDTRFLSKITIQPTAEDRDNNNKKYVFACHGVMEMRFSIPSALRKAMGKDKSKHETRMSNLIARQIEKDMIKAVSKWHSTYESWIESRCTTTV